MELSARKRPGHVAQLVAHLTKEPAVPVKYPIQPHTFAEIDHEIFLTVVFLLPLIQEGQLSFTG